MEGSNGPAAVSSLFKHLLFLNGDFFPPRNWLKPTSDPFVIIYMDCWFTAEHLKRQKLSSSVKTKQLLTCSENAHCGDSYLDEPLISSQV